MNCFAQSVNFDLPLTMTLARNFAQINNSSTIGINENFCRNYSAQSPFFCSVFIESGTLRETDIILVEQ